jgi:hypothetical protein
MLLGDVIASTCSAPRLSDVRGASLTPLSRPLPFFAYPFLALTLFGWAWAHLKRPMAAV